MTNLARLSTVLTVAEATAILDAQPLTVADFAALKAEHFHWLQVTSRNTVKSLRAQIVRFFADFESMRLQQSSGN